MATLPADSGFRQLATEFCDTMHNLHKVGFVRARLGNAVCVSYTTIVELGIPDTAIRDSEPSSSYYWIDARRLRRHMRKYNRFAQRAQRSKREFFGQQVLSGCAVRAGIQMWDARRYRK